MLLDALETIQKLISSRPGQLAAGGVLAGIVLKSFERMEAVLTDNTKLEIAVWLLDRKKLSPTFQSWPDTLAKVFDLVFGAKHLSWKCFMRSAVASLATTAASVLIYSVNIHEFRSDDLWRAVPYFGAVGTVITLLFSYPALLVTRWCLRQMARHDTPLQIAAFLGLGFVATTVIALIPFGVVLSLDFIVSFDRGEPLFELGFVVAWLFVPPLFYTSVWLWLYASSGFLLKAARRFDIGFEWFNKHCDIEKKPLQSIGLVSGAIVALVYWAVVIIHRVFS